MKWYSNDTQIKWVCAQLLKGREISHACEIAEAKGWRLSAIIYNLRHKYKWPIEARYDDSRIAYYRLAKGGNHSELPLPRSAKKKDGVGTPSPDNP